MRKSGLRYLWICILLCFLLAGCTADDPTETVPAGGTVYLTADTVITITYDAEGRVTAVSTDEEDTAGIVGNEEDYAGKDCAEAILALLEKMEQTGHLSEDASIRVSFDEGSDAMHQDIAQKVDEALADHNWKADVEVIPPATVGTVPTQPSVGPNVPDGAQIQADGTYILVQYVNALNNEVEQSKAENILTTVYAPDGSMISSELVSVKTGAVRQAKTYQYEGGVLACVTSQYFDRNGNFQSHYCEYLNHDGTISKKISYDRDGNADNSTEYSYFDNGELHTESCYYADGTPNSVTVYDYGNVILSKKLWHTNGVLSEENTYTDGVLATQALYSSDGEMTLWMEYWPNGQVKLRKSLGFHYNDAPVDGWCVYESSEDGVLLHDVTYWPDDTVCSEFYYYYPSGNIKSTYHRDPSNSYNPEYYAEYKDGASAPYTGWNIVEGKKVYFGQALQENNPDKVYDENGNLLYYTVTENGYTYSVTNTYDNLNRRVTQELLGEDGSREYSEYGDTAQGWGLVYSERTGKYCSEPDAVREIYDHRSGMHHYESYYKDGGSRIMDDSESGKPYYLAYFYADGRREIYEYDEGELTYMYIECEDGTVIEQGTPRGN